ncbi:MAG: polyphosphate kinase 1 [Candidatus Endonucleobacter bathymodioli]|uniref:Polyphosphate kinase n=1 Tax=Candidatus Endonucleibacter bathymodioli TaxID=539814 RepID=A0AA90SX42_9GAMM|nr:polyphosphate kinase 1 [Candidatus Endonucleobacter bathymodioli]
MDSSNKIKTPSTHRGLAATTPVLSDYSNHEYYNNRELSHLQFNVRVLEQAEREGTPLLERLRFLLIFSSNMDEFFEIRVAGLMGQVEFSDGYINLDGMGPQAILKEISKITKEQVQRQYQIFNDTLLPALRDNGIHFLKREELSEKQRSWVKRFFYNEIMPIINPIGLDPAHPFPRLANKLMCFIVSLEGRDAFGRETGMAIIPAPRSLPRIIRLSSEICGEDGESYVFLSSIIHNHAEDLFPGMAIKGCYQFRLTRNSDLYLEDKGEDLAKVLQGELLSRRYGKAVRLEIVNTCPRPLINFLLKEFGLGEEELYQVDGPVNLSRMMSICDSSNKPELTFKPFIPSFPKSMKNNIKKSNDIMDIISKGDMLLLHPFESFTPVVDMLRQAAKDPNVLAIRQTLYRTGALSTMVSALVDAARNGKEVTVVVEIRARFDEEENIKLAKRLQDAGATVVYGVVGYKTHAKMMLIVRREGRQIRRYAHLGTGNYHAINAKLYTDYSFLTCDQDITNDVRKIFQQLTGMGRAVRVRKLFHAPFTLKKGLIDLINQERANANKGLPAHIIIKLNSLTEYNLIKALYKASQAGVKIDLIIRTICCLKPGIKGLSENITVRSIVGRFLEHTRVFYFVNNDNPRVYCSSADGMDRNLDMRIEICFPIGNTKLASRIKKELDLYLSDNVNSWQLKSDGCYSQNTIGRGKHRKSAQDKLLITLASLGQ